MKHRTLLQLFAVLMCVLAVACSKQAPLPDEPVRPSITLENQRIDYLSGESCWFGTKPEGICSDPLHPDIFYSKIQGGAVTADPGGVIRIKFPVEPDECILTVTNSNGEQSSIGKPNPYRYTLPEEPGYYRYTLSAVWEEKNSASYYFGISIKE